MLKSHTDVRVITFAESIALNVSCTVCHTTVGFCTTVQRMTPGVIAQEINCFYDASVYTAILTRAHVI
jgi:hypothetical protein